MGIFDEIQSWLCDADSSAEDIKNAIRDAEQALNLAERSSEFMRTNRNLRRRITRVRRAFTSISNHIDSVENICSHLEAVGRIRDAIGVLNQNGIISRDPEAATQAFGNLFKGLAHFATLLPSPANMYSQFLEGLGNDFFQNVRAGVDPRVRPRDQRFERQIQRERPNVGRSIR